MHEIAKLIFKMYENTKPDLPDPENYDKVSKEFLMGLSKEQASLFYDLESMYLEITENSQIAILEFLLNLFIEE